MFNNSVSPINSLTAIFSISIFLPPLITELEILPLKNSKRGVPDLNKIKEWWFG
jgi:hypothetical protein